MRDAEDHGADVSSGLVVGCVTGRVSECTYIYMYTPWIKKEWTACPRQKNKVVIRYNKSTQSAREKDSLEHSRGSADC